MKRATHVKRGCLDCVSKETPCAKEPCKSCNYYSNWKDKKEAEKA